MNQIDPQSAKAAPSPGGPPVTELQIGGMTCSHCLQTVSSALHGVSGVATANVVLERGQATVKWRADTEPDVTALLTAVRNAGFTATRAAADDPRQESPERWWPLTGWRLNVLLGVVCTLPLIAGEWIFRLGTERWFHWLAFVLATPVQIIAGSRFYAGAWNQLKARRSNMDTLVALGSTTAYVFSLWGLFSAKAGHLYFMESAAIITLVSLGHWMEARASARAAGSLRALLNLAPPLARKRDPQSGNESEVPAGTLRPGDEIVLRPGDRAPTDGTVVAGGSAVDESMLTGESLPSDKNPGDPVYAGTVNLNGRLLARVTATGDATALAHIIAAVQRAQTSHANIQRLGDKISSVFVPIVVLIALGTAFWWGLNYDRALQISGTLAPFLWHIHLPETALAAAAIHAAAVLIIACPCAMGLATPVAIMAGTNAAAQRGVLIRDGIALEKAGKITAVLFDKTGTLTRGKPAVTHSEIYRSGNDASRIEIHLAAGLARPSNHPISQSVAALHPDDYPLSDWREVRGAGVQARIDLTSPARLAGILRLGSLQWLESSGVDVSPSAASAKAWMNTGASVLGLALDRRLIALLALQDTLKSGADDVVARLRRQGMSIYMITGDNRRTALAVAAQAGIAPGNVFAEVRPEDKAALVRQLQSRGERVAFVGDGINDAPALEQANLGIAVSKASDVASEAADIILLRTEIHAVPEALGLARATLRKIKQNLFWAFFYNSLGVPLAALGFLSPVLCALAMGASDLIVIGNALLLRRWKS